MSADFDKKLILVQESTNIGGYVVQKLEGMKKPEVGTRWSKKQLEEFIKANADTLVEINPKVNKPDVQKTAQKKD